MLTPLPTSASKFYVIVKLYCGCLTRTCFSPCLPSSIAKISWWVLYWIILSCVCVNIWPDVTCFFLCHHAALPTTGGGKLYRMVLLVYVWISNQKLSLPVNVWLLHCQHQPVSYVCNYLTKSNLFLSLSAPSIINIRQWVCGMVLCCACVLCLTRSNLFLSLSTDFIANISGWVWLMVLCCVWVYFWTEVTCFSPCLLSPLPTSASEFYWMDLCCACVYVWPEVTCFSSCLLPPLSASAGEFD